MTSVARGRLLLYAPNVHTGGGLILLKALLQAWPADGLMVAWLDQRARDHLTLPAGAQVQWVRAAVASRLAAELSLWRAACRGDRVLCFHGLPPLLTSQAAVHVFLQNRLYLGQMLLSGFSWRTRLRLRLEQVVSRLRRRTVAGYWVQSASMARSLRQWWGEGGGVSVRIAPFVPAATAQPARSAQRWDFVYVADGEAHKNHRRLVEAWVLLAQQGFKPSLALTLSARDAALREWIEGQARKHDLKIGNLGQMSHAEVLALYRSAGALVFPSKGESFGLPLIEAQDAGLPILAGELDFVRDVCAPVQTFDPGSPVSIARAVRRFLGQNEAPLQTIGAAEFLRSLMDESA